jgi:ADP-ribose pyrophosphatase
MELLYNGRFFKLYKSKIKIKGKSIEYEKMLEPKVVVILPIENRKIIIEKQYRPAINKFIYELPAGHIEKGERPEKAAKRELLEETGYIAKELYFMFKAYPEPGISTSLHNFFYATKLSKSARNLDKDEIISTIKVSLDESISMIKKGEIIDMKSIAAILFYKNFID